MAWLNECLQIARMWVDKPIGGEAPSETRKEKVGHGDVRKFNFVCLRYSFRTFFFGRGAGWESLFSLFSLDRYILFRFVCFTENRKLITCFVWPF